VEFVVIGVPGGGGREACKKEEKKKGLAIDAQKKRGKPGPLRVSRNRSPPPSSKGGEDKKGEGAVCLEYKTRGRPSLRRGGKKGLESKGGKSPHRKKRPRKGGTRACWPLMKARKRRNCGIQAVTPLMLKGREKKTFVWGEKKKKAIPPPDTEEKSEHTGKTVCTPMAR